MNSFRAILQTTLLALLATSAVLVLLGLQSAGSSEPGLTTSPVEQVYTMGSMFVSSADLNTDCQVCCTDPCASCSGWHHSPFVANGFTLAKLTEQRLIATISITPPDSYYSPDLRPPIALS